jgi:hypothetical protein
MLIAHHEATFYLPHAWEEGQTCVGLNIPFYIDMTMFIGEFRDQGWPQGV